MTRAILEKLRDSQTERGAFPAVAHLPNGECLTDETSFVTALMIDLLLPWRKNVQVRAIIEKAVVFIHACESTKVPGFFYFYAPGQQPRWIPEWLPPDVDDTALCNSVLYRLGKRSLSECRSNLKRLQKFQLNQTVAGEDWYSPGIYPTWLYKKKMHNSIDLCANVNLMTYLHVLGESKNSYAGISKMVTSAIQWSEEPGRSLTDTSPFYPHPGEIIYAIARSAGVGVPGAADWLKTITSVGNENWNGHDDLPICSSIGAGMTWSAPILQQLRRYWQNNLDFKVASFVNT